MLSAAYVVAITDLQMPATVSSQAGANDDGRRPRFLSNGIMVKLTPQARASLRTSGEDVNPAATGLVVLDAIDRDHGVQRFTAVTDSVPHRDPTAGIHRWFKLTLPGNAQRLTLIEPTNVSTRGARGGNFRPHSGHSIRATREVSRVECHFECHCAGKTRKRTRTDESR